MGEPWVCNPQRARRFESKVSSLGFFDRHYGAICGMVWGGRLRAAHADERPLLFMNTTKSALVLVLSAGAAFLLVAAFSRHAGGGPRSTTRIEDAGQDPDTPPGFGAPNGGLSREEFMLRRAEYIGLRRGVDKNHPADPHVRQDAIAKMEIQMRALASMPDSPEKDALTAVWTELGPNPIP